jgi:hypothetical protein
MDGYRKEADSRPTILFAAALGSAACDTGRDRQSVAADRRGSPVVEPRQAEPRWREGEHAWIALPENTAERQADFAHLAGLEPSHRSVAQPPISGLALADRPEVRAHVRGLGMQMTRGALPRREYLVLAVAVSALNDCRY